MIPLRVWQEFYCNTSGGGCGGYVLVKLNMALNRCVTVVCPKCQHNHQRAIVNGELHENGRFATNSKEEIHPPLSAWSEKSLISEKLRQANSDRDAVNLEKLRPEELQAAMILRQSWIERHAGKLIGEQT